MREKEELSRKWDEEARKTEPYGRTVVRMFKAGTEPFQNVDKLLVVRVLFFHWFKSYCPRFGERPLGNRNSSDGCGPLRARAIAVGNSSRVASPKPSVSTCNLL